MNSHPLRESLAGLVLSAASLPWVASVSAQPNSAQPKKSETFSDRDLQFFEAKVRPLLVKHCYACHSTDSDKAEGNLLMDSRPDLLKGGDSGPAVVVGDPRRSILMRAVLYEDLKLAMPPSDAGGKLRQDEIAILEQWIRMGLPDPRHESTAKTEDSKSESLHWWAFQPIQDFPVPESSSAWAKTAIDRFVAKTHTEKNLQPSPQAEWHVLLRRLHFDLTGLPPQPTEIASFEKEVKATSFASAYAKRVDDLLASLQFGVHWGRHWLDVARYAESTGRDINVSYPYAWRYRDYVIDSFNQDKSYSQFLREQLAGDLLAHRDSKEEADHLIATGFLAIGSRAINEMNPRQFALDQADEQIDTVFQATMGLTLACARCHDHKFDPISQKEYTAVAGIFLSTKTLFGVPNIRQARVSAKPLGLPTDANLAVTAKPMTKAGVEEMLARLKDVQNEMEEMRQELFRSMQGNGNNPSTDAQRQIQRRFALESQKGQLESRIMEYDDDGTPVPLAMAVVDKPATSNASQFSRFVTRDFRNRSSGFESITDSPFFSRGDLEMAGDTVARGVPTFFGNSQSVSIPSNTSGRSQLADWIVDPSNPMTARVAVNRVWNWLIGQGLVTSVDNFGTTGSTPSHPELLDYLAKTFQSHWSTKKLVREIVMSATYQQSSAYHESHFKTDPENAFLWRMNARRVEAESIRDAVLSATGSLDLRPQLASSIGFGGVAAIDRPLQGPPTVFRRPSSSGPVDNSKGRSVYLGLPRDSQPEILQLFDMPDSNAVQGKRESTNVPAQSLFMLNSEWISKQSQAVANRIVKAFPGKSMDQFDSRLMLAYQLTVGRNPSHDEASAAKNLISQMGANPETAWSSLARGLFASAEFRYLD
jgi:Protein of unknown function (DUF1553)/Protein of unknown function (DUF1549)/Planctomycete cytochrome C